MLVYWESKHQLLPFLPTLIHTVRYVSLYSIPYPLIQFHSFPPFSTNTCIQFHYSLTVILSQNSHKNTLHNFPRHFVSFSPEPLFHIVSQSVTNDVEGKLSLTFLSFCSEGKDFTSYQLFPLTLNDHTHIHQMMGNLENHWKRT